MQLTPAFNSALEIEYLRRQLLQSRPLIRAGCVLGLVLATARAAERLSAGTADRVFWIEFGLLATASLFLTVQAFRPRLERHYLPWAEVIVPLRNVLAAGQFALSAARGDLAVLMFLPLTVIAPFFFLGLRLRASLLAGLASLAPFVILGIANGLERALLVHAALMLTITLLGCTIAGRKLECAARAEFLERHRVLELAERDALTGMQNRRVFDERLEQLWQRAIADERALALMLIDVDHFKAYNDRHGHLAGDEALRRIASTLQALVPGSVDVLARYGGEEFAAVLYDLKPERAERVAERMRRAVRALRIQHHGERHDATVTISIGLAVIRPVPGRSCRGALQLADQALYEAKLKGRDRIERVDDAHYQSVVTGVFPSVAATAGQHGPGS